MDERAARFRERMQEKHGFEIDRHELGDTPTGDDPAETARTVAGAVDCEPAQVARATALVADTLVVAVVGGSGGVDPRALATARGVHRARPAGDDETETALDWPADGLPPLCHDAPVYVDGALTDHESVWGFAGTPNVVFPLSPETLVDCADATVIELTT